MIQKIRNRISKLNTKDESEKEILIQIEKNKGKQIQFYNFWEQKYEDMFWYRFLHARPEFLNCNTDIKFGFFSVFGDRSIIDRVDTDINIFFNAENAKVDNYFAYTDQFLGSKKIHLSIGFEYFEHERYVRFPNWMDVFFLKTDEVKSICNKLRYPNVDNKDRFASCVASHGGKGLRDSIVDALTEIDIVSCPGKFRHNDDSLFTQYDDNKLDYLKRFQFNICPENSNAMGYVTEKLFQAISAGCIPIYWGSYNRPELDVLNQDAIIFWDPNGDNTNAVKLIRELYDSPKLMKEFLSLPRLIESADEYILQQLNEIETKIYKLLK